MVRIPGIKAVVFDLDDTLYPEKSFVFSGFRAVAAWLRRRVICPFDPAERMCFLFEQGARGHIFDRVLAEMNCTDADTLVPLMVECYRAHRPEISLFEDGKRALERWRAEFHLALISDGPLVMQQNKVDALGLPDRLDLIILTDQWGREFWKPHPRAFEVVQTTWGLDGEACLYIADNVEKDFFSPLRLGWRTVRICREGAIYDKSSYDKSRPDLAGRPEFEVTTFGEIDLSF